MLLFLPLESTTASGEQRPRLLSLLSITRTVIYQLELVPLCISLCLSSVRGRSDREVVLAGPKTVVNQHANQIYHRFIGEIKPDATHNALHDVLQSIGPLSCINQVSLYSTVPLMRLRTFITVMLLGLGSEARRVKLLHTDRLIGGAHEAEFSFSYKDLRGQQIIAIHH